MVFRASEHKGNASLDLAEKLAMEGDNGAQCRQEFIHLVRSATKLKSGDTAMPTDK
jgi:hypothetical protein